MKKWMIAIALGLFIQGAAWAQLINAKSVVGEVSSQKGNSITIKQTTEDLTLGLTDDTQIILGSELKAPKDIRVGDQVRAVYRERGSQKVALVITITSGR